MAFESTGGVGITFTVSHSVEPAARVASPSAPLHAGPASLSGATPR